MKVLNAFLQSLVGVLDFANVTGDPRARAVYNLGDIAAQRELPRFDTGAWSLYAQGGAESTLNYHELVTGFLGSLCARTANPAYCATQTRFTTYLHQPPRVSISFDGPRRVRRTMGVRVALSKVSTVALRIRRGSRVIVARDVTPGPRDARVQARAEPPRHACRRRPGPRPRRQRRGRVPHGAGLSEVLAAAPVRGLTDDWTHVR